MSKELISQQEEESQEAVSLDSIKFNLQKSYLLHADLKILPIDKIQKEALLSEVSKDEIKRKIRFYEMEKFVYEKDVKVTSKLKSVFTTLHSVNSSLLFKIVSDGTVCSIYIGVKSGDKVSEKSKVLKGAIEGNFPGTKLSNHNENLSNQEVLDINNKIFDKCKEITAVVGIPSLKDKDEDQFFQGIENLILGMNGKPFSAILVADPVTSDEVDLTLDTYEQIYSVLSSEKEFVVTEGTNSSISNSISLSNSSSTSKSTSLTEGTNETKTNNPSPWIGRKFMNGFFGSGSKSANYFSKKLEEGFKSTIKYGTATAGSLAGNFLAGPGGAILGANEGLKKGKELSEKLDLKTKAEGSVAKGINKSKSSSDSTSMSETTNSSNTNSSGNSSSHQKTFINKKATNFLDRLDKQIERLEQGKGTGFWNVGVYFMSDVEQNSVIAANIYNGIIKGAESNFETAAIKTFNSINRVERNKVSAYLRRYELARIENYGFLAQAITTDELTVQVNFPHKSVVGLDVVMVIPFGNNPKKNPGSNINIGSLYNYEKQLDNDILLDYNKFTSHILVTGSTGSGKSNVTYNLIEKLCDKNITFLVIEPAKGEYKEEFGGRANVCVYGTNSSQTELLRINPFSFPESIHVYEHIDRFIEILNACWPMEAAMPNILKEAIEDAYVSKGWLLDESRCVEGKNIYPLFSDLLSSLENVIAQSKFSEELKSNYEGALVSRVRSMTNGLNKLIFTDDCISDEELFDKNVIVDLSRVASSEGKALFMGILFMKLNEYRIANKSDSNSGLKHITVIEEAHNLLKRTSSDQSGSSANLIGKSVEMISNAIAEMRTYGEGFIIADQAPGLLDMSVIRNTNTKICLRLPDFEDRKLVGESMNLSEDQIKELAKLETGVAAIYQNDWQEAILCKFNKFESQDDIFIHEEESDKKAKVEKVLNIIAVYEETKKISNAEIELIHEVIKLDFLLRQKWPSTSNSLLRIELIKKLRIILEQEKGVNSVIKYIVSLLNGYNSTSKIKNIKI
jgi:hypothetical protein